MAELPRTNAAGRERGWLRFIAKEWSDPASRGGLLMMANTGITGALGLVYWTVAARLYPQTSVGRASALVSMASLLATVGQLNLGGTLVRFLPAAGARSRALVVLIYGIACGSTLVLTGLVELVIGVAGGHSSELRLSALDTALFTLCVLATVIFVLQDYVLIGIRRIGWLAVENGSFGFVKLVLLIVLTGLGGWGAVFASWMLPLVATLPVVAWLLFGRLLPRQPAGERPAPIRAETKRRIRRFAAGDAVAGIFAQSWAYALPPIVDASLGSAANAQFYSALVIASVFDLVGANYVIPMVSEAAHNPEEFPRLFRSAAQRIYVVLIPPAILFMFAGGLVLHIYGSSYTSAGTALGLLALGGLPRGLLTLYYAVCNVTQHTHRTAIIQGVFFALVVTGSLLFAHDGITSVAIVVLVVSSACGAAVLPSLVRVARSASV